MSAVYGHSRLVRGVRIVVWTAVVYSSAFIVTYILCGAGVIGERSRQRLDTTIFAPVMQYQTSKLPGSVIVQRVASMAYHAFPEDPAAPRR